MLRLLQCSTLVSAQLSGQLVPNVNTNVAGATYYQAPGINTWQGFWEYAVSKGGRLATLIESKEILSVMVPGSTANNIPVGDLSNKDYVAPNGIKGHIELHGGYPTWGDSIAE